MTTIVAAIIVLLNGQAVQFPDAKPAKVQGRVMVPLRGVFEAMNAFVQYSANERSITAVRGDRRVELKVGARTAQVNGSNVALEVPAVAKTGRVLVPLRFIAESLDANVFWDGADNTVRITTRNTERTPPTSTGGTPTGTEGSTPPTGGIRAGEIELRISSEKKYYKSGEKMRFTLLAINQDDRPRTINFRTGQSFDITVTPANGDELVRWDWSHDRMFTQALREVTLKPGETMKFEAVWNQQNNEGSEMPRGDYNVSAKLTAETEVLSPTISIRLVG